LGAKFDNNGPISRAKSCFFFEEGGVLQKIIHALKYEGMRSLGIQLGKHLGEAVLVDDWLRFADVLIPVPLHKTKQRERGYNQSDYLCRGVCQKTSLPYRNDMLRRWKYT
jgi:predicted amidophosphoribosyltransferase